MFTHIQKAELEVNASKSYLGTHIFDYLGYNVTPDRVMPIPEKVEAIQDLAVPKICKQLGQFIGMINFYHEKWKNSFELLAPITALTSKNIKYNWKDEHKECFDAK